MSLFRSSLVVSLLTLFGSIVSFVNQLVIAHLFGASFQLDAYLVASSIPLMVSGTIAAVLNYSMVPVLILQRSQIVVFGQFAGMMLFSVGVIAVLISSFGFIASPLIISLLAMETDSPVRGVAVLMARISWATSGMSVISAYLCALHNANKRFYLPASTILFPYIGMIVCGMLFGKEKGPLAIAWGMLLGTALGGLFLLKGSAGELGFSVAMLQRWREVTRYLLTTPLIFIAMGCFTIYQSVDSFWATRIGEGNLACLGYAQRLLIAIGSLVIAGPSAVLAPRLAELHCSNRQEQFFADLFTALRMILVISVPIAVMVSILASPIIQLIFQRGEFDEATAGKVASLLPPMMTGMVAMLCMIIMFRAFYARRKYSEAAFLGSLNILLYFVLSGVLSRFYHILGISHAYLISWWVTLFAAIALFRTQYANAFSYPGAVTYIFRFTSSVIVMGIVVYISTSLCILPLKELGYWNLGIRVGSILLVGVIVFYLAAAKMFKISEVQNIATYFAGKYIKYGNDKINT